MRLPNKASSYCTAFFVLVICVLINGSNSRRSVSAYSPSSGSRSRKLSSLSYQQQQQQQQQRRQQHGRRAFLVKSLTTFATSAAVITSTRGRREGGISNDVASALDIDAFMNNELSKPCDPSRDKKCAPKLSEDEALCRFGQPSPATGQACVRAGLSSKRPGGVDAFGKIDRGGFVKCKAVYEREDPNGPKGMLMKEWKCE